MNSRNTVVLAALFAFGCAAQQTPPTSAPAKPATPPATAQTAAAAEPAKPPPPSKEEEKKSIEAARAALEAQRAPTRDAVAAVADKNAANAVFDKAREELGKLEKLLADGQPLEKKDEEYAREAAVAKLELDKAKADFDARWLESGAGLQKVALDESFKQLTLVSKTIAAPKATAEDLAKAEAAIASFGALIDRGTVFESKDAKYAQFAVAKKQQLEATKKALEANRLRIAVAAQQDQVTKAKQASDAAVAKLKTATEEAELEAAKTALAALEEALTSGKELEATAPNYLKFAAAIRAAVDKSKAEIEAQKSRQKIAIHKTSVETARTAAKEALLALAKAPEAAGFEAAAKTIGDLEKSLEAGKDFVAADKTYAQYAAAVAKELAAHRATVDRLKQQGEISGDRTRVAAVVTEADAKMTAMQQTPSAETIGAAEQALAQLEAALKAAEPLAAKDKAYANEVAALTKKLAAHRAVLGKKSSESKIAEHRAKVAEQRAKATAAVEALKGKLEQQLYIQAEDEVAILGKFVDDGASLAEADPKYGKELDALRNTIAPQRAQIRIHRVQAANGVVAERMKALAGQADEAAFKAALEAVHVLRNTVESAKSFTTTDKNYVALMAQMEKQVPLHQAAIEKRRADLEVEKQRAVVDAAATALAEKLKALEGEPESSAFSAAESAASELESAIQSGVSIEDKAHQAYVAASQKKVEAARAQIAKRKVEVAVAAEKKKQEAATAAVKEKLQAIQAEPNEAGFNAAEESVAALESALNAAQSVADNDPKYAKELAASKAALAQYRAQIEKKKTEVAVAAAKSKIDAAAAAVAGALKAGDKIDEAEQALDGLEGALNEGDAAAAKDGKLAAQIAALRKNVPAQRAVLTKKKLDAKVGAHRAEVAAKKAKVEESLGALKGALEQPLYETASEAIVAFEAAISSGDAIAEEDAKYGNELKALKNLVAVQRTQIRRVRIEAGVAAVVAQLKGLEGEPEAAAFERAEEQVEMLGKIVDWAKKHPSTDKAFLGLIAATEKQMPAHTAAIEKRRVGIAIAAHKKERDAAVAAVNDRLKALAIEASDGAFSSSEEAIAALEKVLGSGGSVAEKDPKYGKELEAIKARIPAFKAQIEKRRVDVAMAEQREKIEAARAAAEKEAAALASGESADGAERAVAELEKLLGEESPSKDKKHLQFLAAAKAKVPAYRTAIDRHKAAKQIAAHGAELSAAESEVAEKMSALEGKTDQELYIAAEDAVDRMRKVAEAGMSLGGKDPAFGKRIDAVLASVPKYRAAMRKKRVEAASGFVAARMAALEGKADDAAFVAAESALRDLTNTISSARDFKSEEKDYAKFLDGAEKRAEANRALVEKRKTQIVVDAHRGELDEALKAVDGSMKVLAGKAEPAAFEEAEKAVSQLETTINSGSDAANKDAQYGKRLEGLRDKLDGYRKTIEKRRFDAEVAGHREKLNAAVKAVTEKLGALGEKADEPAFGAAEEAISDLESVIKEGGSYGEKNKGYEKELAVQDKKIGGYRGRIASRRAEVERAAQVAQLNEAEEAVTEKLAGLSGKVESTAYDAADEAVAELEKVIGATESFAKQDKALGKRLAGMKKGLPAKRAQIAAARIEVELRGHREAVQAAVTEVEKRIEVLENDTSQGTLRAADGAVKSLENALSNGAELAKKSKKHAAYVASFKKRIAEFKSTIGRRAVEDEVKAHRAEVDEAKEKVKEKLAALKGQLEYALYEAAESAVDELRKAIEGGAEFEEKDAAYGKELAAARSAIDRHRVEIRRRWIEAADADASEKIKALDGKATEADFAEAQNAVRVFANTVESGKSLAAKDKAYAKFAATAEKKARVAKATIEKKKSILEFADVRAELESAVKMVADRMSALAGEKETAAFDDAGEALDALERAIDSNGPAAEKDKAHAKRLAVLKKKVAADRGKVEKMRAAIALEPYKAKVAEAESALAEKVAALKSGADAAAFDAAEEAASELESVLDESKTAAPGNKGVAKTVGKARKKVAAARAAIKNKKGLLAFAEHRGEVESALTAAKDAVAALEKGAEPAAIESANDAVKSLVSALDSGKALGKKDKKHGAFLAASRKTSKTLAAAIKKAKKRAAAEAVAAKSSAGASEDEAPAGEAEPEKPVNPAAKLDAARKSVKKSFAALGPRPNETALTSARASLDELESALEEAKASGVRAKPFLKKVAAANKLLAKQKKVLAAREAAASKVDHPGRLKETWAAFARQVKALKKKKATLEDFDAALEAASEVEAALREGDRAGAAKNPKYKKLARDIRKKLEKERAALKKKREASEYS